MQNLLISRKAKNGNVNGASPISENVFRLLTLLGLPTMNVADEIMRLAQEADVAMVSESSRGLPDIEPHCLSIVKIARDHPEQRQAVIEAIQRIGTGRGTGAWEVLLLVVHLLRWPDLKEFYKNKRDDALRRQDWRGEPVYRQILEAFSEKWEDRDMYEMFNKGLTRQ
jgi:hypothetical protein